MPRIQVLAPEVARRIAAGEVIERPASVVKELCENAVDAGARRVAVDLRGGGAAELAVTDDGCGMEPDDAVLAFARHATSKLVRFEDLGALRTLGFRGEALPSIAAVARVELVTRPEAAAAAIAVRIEGGSAPRLAPAAAAPGTRVIVRDLFFNLPARRAALRPPAAELAAAAEVVTGAALARPDVAFRLTHEGREVLATPGDGDLLSAIVALWGPEVARGLLPAQGRAEGWTVSGFCGLPAGARGNRGIQFVSVDGRPVSADGLRGAVEAAYQNLLMTRRYPVFVLRLAAEPGLYDPNVHPSKREVRIYRAERVRGLCHGAVRAALRGADLLREIEVAPPRAGAPGARGGAGVLRFALEAQATEAREEGAPWQAGGAGPDGAHGGPGAGDAGWSEAAAAAPMATPPTEPAAGGRLPPLRAVGQVGSAYLVAEGADGLYLVDQHAAHERVYFEELAARGPGPARLLLRPAPVELTASEWERWERASGALREIGLEAEAFGERTLLVRALPAGYDADAAEALRSLLAQLAGEGGAAATGFGPAALALAACRAAIKAGQRLAAADAAALLEQLGACQDPLHCPHGRPTLLRMGFAELERHFGRR